MSDEGNENDGQVLVRRLLLRMIEDGCTVEDVCHDHPGLLIEVRRQWERVRIVEDRIEALFPPAPQEPARPLL